MILNAPSEYLDVVEESWRRARTRAADTQVRYYKIAGLIVRLQFAGPALLPVITPALAHLELKLPRVEPALTVRLWDSESTNTSMPPSPISREDFTIRGELTGFNTGRHHAAYDLVGRTLSLYDGKEGLGWFCAHDASRVPTHERAAPLRWIYGWLLRNYGRQLVHAAGVGIDQGGVLIVGRGGAGKSNTSVGCLLAGLNFAGDDYCAVAANPKPTIYSLFSSAKLRNGDWARVPLLRANVDDPETEKNLYYLHSRYAGRIKSRMEIRAILLPFRGGSCEAYFERISPRVPLIELSSQSISLLPTAGAEVVTNLVPLLRRLPCYRFHLGSQPKLIPPAISALIKSLATDTADADSHA